jgi:hypothetical protein
MNIKDVAKNRLTLITLILSAFYREMHKWNFMILQKNCVKPIDNAGRLWHNTKVA